MMALIWQQFGDLLMVIGYGGLIVFLLGLYFIFKPRKQQVVTPAEIKAAPMLQVISNQTETTAIDVEAIAGEDVVATQLDLARALIETDRKTAAEKILQFVVVEGNSQQQEEAKQLIARSNNI